MSSVYCGDNCNHTGPHHYPPVAHPADLTLSAEALLRGMVASWDAMDPKVRGKGWPHEAWINDARRLLAVIQEQTDE